MSNQESMFADQEPRQRANIDPREQFSEQAAREGYREPYDGYRQRDDGKIHPQQRPRRRGRLLVILIACAILLLGGIFGYSASSYSNAPTTVSPHTFNMTTANPTLVMNVGGGNVQVHTGTGNSIIIKETRRSSGFASSNDNIAYSQSGNTVTVQDADNFNFFGFNSQSFDVTLPASADLNVQTGSGSVNVAGVNGQVNVQTGSGDITADNMSGQQAILKTGSGDVNLNNVSVQQDVLGTGSGSIDARGLSGQVTLETGSGSTTIEQGALKGDSVLKAGSGGITYTGSLDANGNYRFETGSGDVDLTLPTSSAFNLDAHTGSGSVNNDFGSDQVGGSPQAPLSISTGSGDVNIHKG